MTGVYTTQVSEIFIMTDNTSYFSKDSYAKFLGVELVENNAEYTRCELELSESHKNSFGSVNGAVIFSLASITFATACNNETTSVGLQADIKYINKVSGTRLIAESELMANSKRMGHYQVRVSDDEGNLVAIYSATSQRIVGRQ